MLLKKKRKQRVYRKKKYHKKRTHAYTKHTPAWPAMLETKIILPLMTQIRFQAQIFKLNDDNKSIGLKVRTEEKKTQIVFRKSTMMKH